MSDRLFVCDALSLFVKRPAPMVNYADIFYLLIVKRETVCKIYVQMSSFTGFSSLASLLVRHVLEDGETLRHTLEKVINTFLFIYLLR